ncbi:MAG: sulfotransferase family protein [Bacteroidota bacterium]|nr:sulfotransferase family protein [Bacteroidota bacterium]|tara:strand:- start:557 stop:1264 length:708 start_codon:yes stop_codon:yes gene_type:complete
MKIINLISGPRNLSTALMYSFSRRPDTKVIDEPFYAHYLETTGTDHPGREDTLRSMSTDINKVLDDIFNRNECEVLFLKNMAHHHQQMDLSFLDKMTNLFLVRNPKQLIASFAQVITSPNMKDIGLKKSWELFNKIENQNPVVLDSAEILKNPKSLLSKLCDNLEINFFEEMLSWPSGGIPEDGPWAKYWYKNVHSSSGFAKQKTSSRELPKNCESLYLEALKYYNKLKVNSISA